MRLNPDDSFAHRSVTVICAECSEYMEFAGEGINEKDQRCDLYICIECGFQTAIVQADFRRQPPKAAWDPPDGHYEDL